MQIVRPRIGGIYNHTLSDKPWAPPGVSLIAARRMWSTTRGEGTVVAIIDTGVDYQHPDLAPNIIDGRSFVSSEKDYMDYNGHGTHVAGTIAANGKILGVAPRARMLAVKVLNKKGQGNYSDISRGISWARQWVGKNGERVNVINMSLGGPLPDKTMHREIIRAVQEGIAVVCAAGNFGDGEASTPEISYPAYYPECLAVGAVELNTRAASFTNSNDQIDVVAPGVKTYSTYPENKYVELSGTSMATPHVAGAVALIYSRYYLRFKKHPLPEYIKEYLHYQAIDLGQVGFDQLYGYGLFSFNIDGGKAIRLIIGSPKYLINSKEHYLQKAPFWQNGLACASIEELSDLLGCDSNLVSVNSNINEIDIWN